MHINPLQGYTTHTLRLHSCWEITNHGVVNMVHSLPNLTALSLSGCSKITDDGVELVAENLRKLRSLDLSWCPRITDMALEYIACDLHKLEELVLDRYVSVGLKNNCVVNDEFLLLYIHVNKALIDFKLQFLNHALNMYIYTCLLRCF